MGMYNEIYKKCPNCTKGVGYLQIGQIVLGFGGFDLDDPTTLERLSNADLQRLLDAVRGAEFSCRPPGWVHCEPESGIDPEEVCRRSFRFLDEPAQQERKRLMDQLCGETDA